jgi:hypothetical protein
LGVERVGIHDDFFELGGHSLLALQLIARLKRVFEVDLSVQSVFDAPNVAHMAALIALAEQEAREAADKIDGMLSAVEQLSDHEVRSLMEHGFSKVQP